jgi:hypothetical protein
MAEDTLPTESADAPAAADAAAWFTDLYDNLTRDPAAAYPRVVQLVLAIAVVMLVVHFLLAAGTRHKGAGLRKRFGWFERVIYFFTFVIVMVLGFTAFYSVIRFGHMHRWLLLVHLMAAGAFVVLIALLAVTWCVPARFGRGVDCRPDAHEAGRFNALTKLTYWLMLLAGLATAAPMLLSMLPLLDTDLMRDMLNLHRYAGLLLVIATVLHVYGVWLGRMGWR